MALSLRYMSDDEENDVKEAGAQIDKEVLRMQKDDDAAAADAADGVSHDNIEDEGIPSDVDENSIPDNESDDDELARGVRGPTRTEAADEDDDYGEDDFEGEVTKNSDGPEKASKGKDLDDTYGEEGFDELPADPPTLTLSRKNSSTSLAASPRLSAVSPSASKSSERPESATSLERQAEQSSPEVRV